MSSRGKFQLECEAIVCVRVVFTHPDSGKETEHELDLSPVLRIDKLKKDVVSKLSIPEEEQVWTYKGQELKDHQTLDDVAFDADDVIKITRKLA